MSRPRTIPDKVIFAAISHLIAESGEKAVAFSTVARVTGLAAPSLVQRYGSLPQMIHAAQLGEWDQLDEAASAALAEVTAADRGVQAYLKALSPGPSAALMAASRRNPDLAARAARWHAQVQDALEGLTGEKARAAMLLALWSSQALWDGVTPRAFKMKDAIKRLG